jgi:hypothetical protein
MPYILELGLARYFAEQKNARRNYQRPTPEQLLRLEIENVLTALDNSVNDLTEVVTRGRRRPVLTYCPV